MCCLVTRFVNLFTKPVMLVRYMQVCLGTMVPEGNSFFRFFTITKITYIPSEDVSVHWWFCIVAFICLVEMVTPSRSNSIECVCVYYFTFLVLSKYLHTFTSHLCHTCQQNFVAIELWNLTVLLVFSSLERLFSKSRRFTLCSATTTYSMFSI